MIGNAPEAEMSFPGHASEPVELPLMRSLPAKAGSAGVYPLARMKGKYGFKGHSGTS